METKLAEPENSADVPPQRPARQPIPLSVAVQGFYANGFQTGISNTDVNIIGITDNVPVFKVNMSHAAAKSLVAALSKGLADLEAKIGQPILSSNEIGARTATGKSQQST